MTTIPFRAEQVGSLLRPERLRTARAQHAAGEIDRAALTAVEDDCIREAVRRQETIGLPVVTDGEFRRSWWHFDFLAGLDGVELVRGEKSIQFHGVQTKAESIAVTGPVVFSTHPYADMINHALAGKPADLAVTTHVCRGNFRSSWIAEGGYEPIAQVLLGQTHYDGYFLEYDSERAGGFEPLRHLPVGNQKVVLGLITSKTGALESRDLLRQRLEDASRHVSLDQCALSPQCGFASTEEGNLLSEDEQWAKLRLVVELAAEIWH